MATNLSLDPDLIEQALRLSGEKTKRAAVTMALRELVARRKQREIPDLFRRFEWDATFDYRKERSR